MAFIACIAHKQYAEALRATFLQSTDSIAENTKSRKPGGAPQGETTIPPLSGLGEPPARSGGGERTRARARARARYLFLQNYPLLGLLELSASAALCIL